jgi:hypothetical protein
MSTDLNVMATNIKNILENTPGIREAFDYEPQTMTNLPAATLFFDGFSQTDKASRRQEVGWRWIIRIYVGVRTSNIKQPQEDIRSLVTDSIKQFRSNPDLNGSCLYHTVSSGDIVTVTDQNTAYLLAELTLIATTNEGF